MNSINPVAKSCPCRSRTAYPPVAGFSSRRRIPGTSMPTITASRSGFTPESPTRETLHTCPCPRLRGLLPFTRSPFVDSKYERCAPTVALPFPLGSLMGGHDVAPLITQISSLVVRPSDAEEPTSLRHPGAHACTPVFSSFILAQHYILKRSLAGSKLWTVGDAADCSDGPRRIPETHR